MRRSGTDARNRMSLATEYPTERRHAMSTQDDEFNWRQSLERLGQAALDLVSSLGAHPTGEQGSSSGVQKTETREVSGFTQIKLSGFGTLNITQGETDSLTITA